MQTKLLAPTLGVLALVAPTALQAATKATKGETKPLNVILIVTDDQGYADVGYVGNPNILTPELDRLSSQSIIYDNFHTGTTSAPTRSGLMTGRYGNSTGVWHTIGGRSLLDLEEYTMAEAFEDSGYATAHYGKWHLGDNYPYRPMDRGFQDGLWHKGGGVGQTPDYYNNTYFEDTYFRGDTPEKQTGYCTDVFFSAAEKFIEQSKENDKPFFVYLAANAPHGPYHVDERYVEPFRNNPNILSPEFYGMIYNLDYNVGKLRSFLTRMELDENTIIIFFGDNGSTGSAQLDKMGYPVEGRGFAAGLRGKKGQVYEGGHRQAMLMHIPGQIPTKTEQLTAYIDIMPTLIDVCGLTPSKDVEFDGVNIVDNYNAKGRVFVNDTQRKEQMEEDKMYCVARDEWRLINGKQLYDLSTDRGQRVDVSKQYPEIVKELTAEYKAWWAKTSVRAEQTQYIPLINPNEKIVKLTCHDLHDEENRQNVWNFDFLHTTMKPAPGWWAISLDKATKFTFDAFRWSPEANLPLGGGAPEGRYVPNGTRYPAGAAIDDMVSVVVKVDGKEVAKSIKIDLTKPSATIPSVKIPAGEHNLQVLFADKDGVEYSAWYITVQE
ncbi:MAG: arylsulfatase [Rikenellaceae bacterium]